MKKSRVYFLMVFTYIAIFMLPLIAGNISFSTARSRLMDEVARANLLTLSQSGIGIETELNRIQKMGLFLSQNTTVRKYLASNLSNAEDRYLTRETINILAARLNELSYADDAVLFCNNTTSFVTTDSLAPARLYLNYLAYPQDSAHEDTLAWLDNFRSYYDIYPVSIVKNDVSIPSIIVAQAMPKDNIYNKLGVLLVSIPQHALLSALEAANPDGVYALVTNTGEVLAATDSSIMEMDLTVLNGERGFVKQSLRNGNTWLSYIQLQSYGLFVISALS